MPSSARKGEGRGGQVWAHLFEVCVCAVGAFRDEVNGIDVGNGGVASGGIILGNLFEL